MSTVLAYSTSSTAPAPKVTAATAMRDIAAKAAAAKRVAKGVANHDPLYGTWVCFCICRRCLPFKNDCGGCVADGCDDRFVSHAAAKDYYESFGLSYSAARGLSFR